MNQGDSIQAHMFWAYGDLTTLERLSAVSFVANGFDLKVWTYGPIGNLPEGVQGCDAREIIPEHRVFKYQNGSYAGFSNLFRYAVLCRQGGLWADMDVVCLTPASELKAVGADGLLVTERTKNSIRLNNNVIYHPKPAAGDIIDLAYAIADRYPVEKLEWGDCGPKLLTTFFNSYPKLVPKIAAPDFANPINWWDCPQGLLNGSGELPERTFFLHCYNEMWRRSGTDKNGPYPRDSILGKAFARYEDRL